MKGKKKHASCTFHTVFIFEKKYLNLETRDNYHYYNFFPDNQTNYYKINGRQRTTAVQLLVDITRSCYSIFFLDHNNNIGKQKTFILLHTHTHKTDTDSVQFYIFPSQIFAISAEIPVLIWSSIQYVYFGGLKSLKIISPKINKKLK